MLNDLKTSAIPILGLLTWFPMSGYDLKKHITQSTGYFWHESYGQLYPQLKILCEKGLIRECDVPTTGKRPKKTYEILPAGRDALAAWLSESVNERPLRQELLLKIFFANQGNRDDIRDHVLKKKLACLERLKTYIVIEQMLTVSQKDNPDLKYWLMTLNYGRKINDAEITWCDEIIDKI